MLFQLWAESWKLSLYCVPTIWHIHSSLCQCQEAFFSFSLCMWVSESHINENIIWAKLIRKYPKNKLLWIVKNKRGTERGDSTKKMRIQKMRLFLQMTNCDNNENVLWHNSKENQIGTKTARAVAPAAAGNKHEAHVFKVTPEPNLDKTIFVGRRSRHRWKFSVRFIRFYPRQWQFIWFHIRAGLSNPFPTYEHKK